MSFPFNLPQGIVLLITDQLSAPADFLLHKYLYQHLKKRNKTDASLTKAAILSVIRRTSEVESLSLLDRLAFSNLFAPPISPTGQAHTTAPPLKPIFDLVSESLSKPEHQSVAHFVILDDITTLEWIGFHPLDVMRFVRALRALCIKANATLIVRHHRLSDEPDNLFSHLYQLSTYHLEVRGLASGRSGSVSGEIALHPGPATIPKDVSIIPRSRAMQYRLTDASAVFFEKGTGVAVL
ncbi:hypothetical protein F5887DRAFT_1074220 [Amanita rubescens]|nr:hypothetical protein F5887DRAFT_1074220 [Amanita rubescens]